jgi:hypothetical protein
MFLREPNPKHVAPASRAIAVPIVLGTLVVVAFGIAPAPLVTLMQAAAGTMLTDPIAKPVEIPFANPYRRVPVQPVAPPRAGAGVPKTAPQEEQAPDAARERGTPPGAPQPATKPAPKADGPAAGKAESTKSQASAPAAQQKPQ